MLHFSKLRIIFIFFTTLFFILISSSNFFQSENFFLKKKINLGLDLQGGSYLLLEIDNNPVILQKLQTKVSAIKSLLRVQIVCSSSSSLLYPRLIIFPPVVLTGGSSQIAASS